MISTKLFSTLVGCLLLSCASCASTTDDPELEDVGEFAAQIDYEASALTAKPALGLAPGRLNDEFIASSERYVSRDLSAPELEIRYSSKLDVDDGIDSYKEPDCRVKMNSNCTVCTGTGIYECVLGACDVAWKACVAAN